MHCGPCHPCENAADPYAAGLQDGEPFADYRHAPLVEVAERTRRGLTHDPSMNQRSRVAALLHRDLSNSGQRLSILVERRGVAHDENVWMPRNGEISLYL